MKNLTRKLKGGGPSGSKATKLAVGALAIASGESRQLDPKKKTDFRIGATYVHPDKKHNLIKAIDKRLMTIDEEINIHDPQLMNDFGDGKICLDVEDSGDSKTTFNERKVMMQLCKNKKTQGNRQNGNSQKRRHSKKRGEQRSKNKSRGSWQYKAQSASTIGKVGLILAVPVVIAKIAKGISNWKTSPEILYKNEVEFIADIQKINKTLCKAPGNFINSWNNLQIKFARDRLVEREKWLENQPGMPYERSSISDLDPKDAINRIAISYMILLCNRKHNGLHQNFWMSRTFDIDSLDPKQVQNIIERIIKESK